MHRSFGRVVFVNASASEEVAAQSSYCPACRFSTVTVCPSMVAIPSPKILKREESSGVKHERELGTVHRDDQPAAILFELDRNRSLRIDRGPEKLEREPWRRHCDRDVACPGRYGHAEAPLGIGRIPFVQIEAGAIVRIGRRRERQPRHHSETTPPRAAPRFR